MKCIVKLLLFLCLITLVATMASAAETDSDIEISKVTLRPGEAGVYFTCTLAGDRADVQSYGIALSTAEEPTAENLDTSCLYTSFTRGKHVNSVLLSGIIKPDNSLETNLQNAQMRIYARPYIQTSQGYTFGKTVCIDLRTLVETIDTKWDGWSDTQKDCLRNMYTTYSEMMGKWNLSNLKGNDTPSTMTQNTYNGLRYWLYTPENPVENMPLIVYLHGGSGKGEDLELITGVDGFPQYIRDGKIACDAYIIFPQCPSDQKGWKTMSGKIEELIAYTCDTFHINTEKISLTGHSMGGTGTWSLALGNPDLYYKVAPMSGSVTMSDKNVEKLSNLPIWAFVGDKDKIVDPESSIAMVEALQGVNADAQITIFEGADHFAVPELGYLGTDVIQWLIA